MAEESFQERTEEATPKRKSESREKGQVVRSRELSTMIVLMVSSLAILFLGDVAVKGLSSVMEKNFSLTRDAIFDTSFMLTMLLSSFEESIYSVLPFIVLVLMAAIFSPLLIGGWSFSLKAMAFKWEKMDPIKGVGRIFSMKGLMELVKALGKFLVVLSVATMLIWTNAEEIFSVGKLDVEQSMVSMSSQLAWSLLIISSALIVIALIDVPFQIWDHAKQLKMTRQEVKDEMKQTEGSPEMKRAVQERQHELSRRRMMEEVPKADVIITNPTHYSVALKYDQDKTQAPVVVAKGKDLIAFQIRNVANANNIPIVSAPPLSRAIYYSTDLKKEIPSGLFLAVAQVLAYVYKLKAKGAWSSKKDHSMDDLPVPDELQHD